MPSTALYRPLDAANGNGARPLQASFMRGSHSGKVRSLWPKTANSRRVLIGVIILTMLLVYVVWCAVVSYTDDARGSYGYTTGKFLDETPSYPTSTLDATQMGGQKSSSDSNHGNIFAVAAPLMLEKLKLMGKEYNITTASGGTTGNIQNTDNRSPTLKSSVRVVPPHGGSVSAHASLDSSNMLDSKLTGDSPSTICGESFNDTRIYIQDRGRHDWGNLSIIYFVTPTYPRREQVPELTRLAYTLLHVPRLHWIVADDHNVCNTYLNVLLQRFGIPYTHLASPMPDHFRKAESKPRGVANRRAAVQWLRQHNITTGVLYFGDDDNTYDLKLFSEIRDTKHVSMFPVGLIANYGISGPVVRKGKVIGFLDSWVAGRRWPVDMAGFAVSLSYMAEHPNASMPFKPGYEEDYFLRSIGLNLDMIEPKGNNCTEVLVWHTQTKNHERTKVKIDHEYLDERSNLGALFRALTEMGVSSAADDEGSKAIISKNGKAKPLGYFLS